MVTAHLTKMELFNTGLQTMAQSSCQGFQKVSRWKDLAKAKVIGLGGGKYVSHELDKCFHRRRLFTLHGHVAYEIARETPDLEFVIQVLVWGDGELPRRYSFPVQLLSG